MGTDYSKDPGPERRRRDDDDDRLRRPRDDDDDYRDDYDIRQRGANLADRGSRLVAAIIDGVLTMLCMIPGIGIVVATASGLDATTLSNPAAVMRVALLGGAVMILGALAFSLFLAYMITQCGQTVGKKVMGIRIVRYEDGRLPGFVNGWLLRSFVPGIIANLPYIGGLFAIVDILFIFGAEKRCIHDLIASTKVVVAEPLREEGSDRDDDR